MIVAITGGTGFIGRRLIARHLSQGDTVRYLTRDASTRPIDGASMIVGDLTSPGDELRRLVRDADVLYHCAAELKNEAAMHDTNVLGTKNLIAAANGEVGRWVQLSSTGVYGKNVCGDVDEETAVEPGNTYETSKSAADNLLRDAAAQQSYLVAIVQPSNVYAPTMPNQSLFRLIRMIEKGLFFFIGPPNAVVNYVHVENAVDAMTLCANTNLPSNGRTYIVSDYCSIEEFVGFIASALGRSPPRVRLPENLVRGASAIAGRVPSFPLSQSRIDALTGRTIYRADRIKSELGFANRVSLQDGMSELVLHYKNLKVAK